MVAQLYAREAAAAAAAQAQAAANGATAAVAPGGGGAGAVPEFFNLPLPTPASLLPAHESHQNHGSGGHRSSHRQRGDDAHQEESYRSSGSGTAAAAGVSDSYFPARSYAGPSTGVSSSAGPSRLRSHSGATGPSTRRGDADGNDDQEDSGGCTIVPTTPSFSHAPPNRSRSGSSAATPLASGLVLRHSRSPSLGSRNQIGGGGGGASSSATASGSSFPVPLSDPTRSSARSGEFVHERAVGESTGQGGGVLSSSTVRYGESSEAGPSSYPNASTQPSYPRRCRALDPVLAHVQTRLEAAGLVPPIPLDAEMGDIEGPLSEAFDVQDGQGSLHPSSHWSQRHGAVRGGEGPFDGDRRLSNAAILGASASGATSRMTGGGSSSQPYANGSSSPPQVRRASASFDSRSPLPHRSSASSTGSASASNGAGSGSGAAGGGPSKPASRPVLVSGSLDNTIKLWDVRTGRCLRTFFGHVQGVWSLDADKLRIISASLDRTIKIWDRETGLCQNTLVGHRGAVTCVALGDDKIVSGSDDNDIRVWSFAD